MHNLISGGKKLSHSKSLVVEEEGSDSNCNYSFNT